MSHEKFFAAQRAGINTVFKLFVCVGTFIWLITFADWAFDLQWGYDREGLIGVPLLLGFGVLIRTISLRLLGFFESNY